MSLHPHELCDGVPQAFTRQAGGGGDVGGARRSQSEAEKDVAGAVGLRIRTGSHHPFEQFVADVVDDPVSLCSALELI